jgi:hypothetical protein
MSMSVDDDDDGFVDLSPHPFVSFGVLPLTLRASVEWSTGTLSSEVGAVQRYGGYQPTGPP